MKVSANFSLNEFFPTDFYAKWGEASIWFLDMRIVTLAQFVRDHFSLGVTVNGAGNNYRGFRPPDCTVGGKLSQHRFGRAIDINVSGLSSDAVFDEILKNERAFMKAGLTTLEDKADTPTWTHMDIRETGMKTIKIVKP